MKLFITTMILRLLVFGLIVGQGLVLLLWSWPLPDPNKSFYPGSTLKLSKSERLLRYAGQIGQRTLTASSEAVSTFGDQDPLPGVHMVYMYANGSDPVLGQARFAFSGSDRGEFGLVCVRSARLWPSRHVFTSFLQ